MMMNQLSHRRNEGSATTSSRPKSYVREDEDYSVRPDASKRIRTTVINIVNCNSSGRGGTSNSRYYRFIALLMIVGTFLMTSSTIAKLRRRKRKKLDRHKPRHWDVPTNSSLKDIGLQQIPTCVYSYEGGWGNNVYATLWEYLYIMSQHDDDDHDTPSPCVDGFFRFLFGSLFKNLEICPENSQPLSKCFYGQPKEGWTAVRRDLRQYLAMPKFQKQELLHLNKTAVDEVLSRGCPALHDYTTNNHHNGEQQQQQQQQPHYCGAHVRFGDVFFRNSSRLGHRVNIENRICNAKKLKKEDANVTISEEECFEFVATKVREKSCPNASIPIFLAADHLPFVDYFVQGKGREYPNVLTCSSDDVAAVTHARDLGLDAAFLTDPQITRMMSDWLGLALADSGTSRVFSSTFRETAALGFYL